MKQGLVLLNMGGPNDINEVPVFLKNMFNDPNILSIPNPIRKFVAFMIVSARKKAAQSNYEAIGGKSPLPEITQRLIQKLQTRLPNHHVTCAMNYTPPFADEAIRSLKENNVENVILFSMFPQYSTTTIKSSLEDFQRRCSQLDYSPKMTIIERYSDNSAYNDALIDSVKSTLGDSDASEFELVFSAHGLPVKVIEKGDPYQQELEAQMEMLRSKLLEQNLNFKAVHLAYQSKVGPTKWLEPSLEQTLESLSSKKVIIYPVAFTIDNSETDFELSIEYKEIADEKGFEDYRVCQCLNDSDAFCDLIESLIPGK